MQAIETSFNGYKFRSRLEARWAVFLTALGWEWEYEKEGFTLENGERYLPDFFIPRINTWVEVKGDIVTPQELERCRLLSKGLPSNHCVMLAKGLPQPIGYRCFSGGEETCEITLTSYIRTKGWDVPYYGWWWNMEDDQHAFDAAKSARFEFGQTPSF